DRAAVAAQVADDAPGDLALVERVASALGDAAQRPGEVRVAERVAGLERLAVREEERSRAFRPQELLALAGERGRERVVQDEALVRQPDRRLEQLGPGELAAAVALPGAPHPVDRAWDVGRGRALGSSQRAVLQRRGLGRAGHELEEHGLVHP